MSIDQQWPFTELAEDDMRAYRAMPRECGCGRTYGDPEEERPCREGNCVELWCPCGTPIGDPAEPDGWGPVGCPCQNKEV